MSLKPILLCLLLIGMASAMCYQETATVNTSCGGLNTGNYSSAGSWNAAYPVTRLNDTSWDTEAATQSTANSTGYFYANYIKPAGSQSTSLWMVKDLGGGTRNLTINQSCWDANATKLMFRAISYYGTPYKYSEWDCWNGTAYVQMSRDNSSAASYLLYEEAMWWDMVNPFGYQNLTLTPAAPYKSDTLNCSFYLFNSNSSTANIIQSWSRNGVLNQTNEEYGADVNTTYSYLLNESLVQTQNWSCAINISNGVYNASGATANVTVLNHAPTITSLVLSPAYPSQYSNLTCVFVLDDDDSPYDVLNATVKWYKDGALNKTDSITSIASGATTTANLSYTLVDNQTWGCTMNATDGFDSVQSSTANATVTNTNVFIDVSCPASYETVENIININMTLSGENITRYDLVVTYNNTVVKNVSVLGLNGETYTTHAHAVSPLMATNNTNITYMVDLTVQFEHGAVQNITSYNHTIYQWYNVTNYTMALASTNTIEAEHAGTITAQAAPTGAAGNVSYTSSYGFSPCIWRYANSTNVSTACTNATITSSGSAFTISASHLSYPALIAQSYYINRSHALIFNATPESASSRTLSITNVSAGTEYFVWLTNSTNGTINGTAASANLTTIFNVSFYDESTWLNKSIDSVTASYTVLFPDGDNKSFIITAGNGSVNNINTFMVRGFPSAFIANLSAMEVYTGTNYTTRTRFLMDAAVPFNQSNNINIYLYPLSSSTYVIINIQKNRAPVENAYVQITKYHAISTSSGEYVNIDQEITDANGQAGLYTDLAAYYKFAVYSSSGSLLYTSSTPQKFVCSSSPCSVTIDLSSAAALYYLSASTVGNCFANLTANSLVCSYSDYTGMTSSINFLAWRSTNNSWGAAAVCNGTVTGSSGGYTCALPTGENFSLYAYTWEIRITSSPPHTVLVGIEDWRTIAGYTDWIMLVILSIICFGAAGLSPVAGIIITVVGVAILGYTGVVPISQSWMVAIALSGGVIVFLMTRRDKS